MLVLKRFIQSYSFQFWWFFNIKKKVKKKNVILKVIIKYKGYRGESKKTGGIAEKSRLFWNPIVNLLKW